MNVVHTCADSTSEGFFRAEWDRDSNRHASRQSYLNATPQAERGIPGFCDSERARFGELLRKGQLLDVWRQLHPVPAVLPDAADPFVTWRGSRAVHQSAKARYEGMGQRLDYFLTGRTFFEERVVACEILGSGVDRVGFVGSDHCPVLLELKTHQR